ncbi:hypothetical protein [Aquabacterium sp.]|uniref:hypothetical protein n=1 Tax=Aquabacterium sp. TaxID=1872578 RepID=UPI0035B49FC9
MPTPPRFSDHESTVLRALAAVLLPVGGPIALSHADVDVLAFAQRFVADAPPHARWLMKGTLHLLERLGWLWCQPVPRRFTRLSAAQQARVIDGWRTSRLPTLRSALQVVSLLVLVPFYQDPRVLRALGVGPGQAPGVLPALEQP